jgi:hypothetical protein
VGVGGDHVLCVAQAGRITAEGTGRDRVAWNLVLGLRPVRVPATAKAVTGTSGTGGRQSRHDEQG